VIEKPEVILEDAMQVIENKCESKQSIEIFAQITKKAYLNG